MQIRGSTYKCGIHTIQAQLEVVGNKKIFVGGINIDGKISTNHQVEVVGDNHFIITPRCESKYLGKMMGRNRGFISNTPEPVTPASVTIDGKTYEGQKLEVKNDIVTILSTTPTLK